MTEQIAESKKSKLHVRFGTLYGKECEILQAENGDYYYAPIEGLMDVFGNRMGARFLGTSAWYENYGDTYQG